MQCGAESVAQPIVSVVDANTMRSICDAKILVTSADVYEASTGPAIETSSVGSADTGVDGSAPLSVMRAGDASGQACTYAIDDGAATGVYTLQVSRPGYTTETVSNVHFVNIACGTSLPEAQAVVVVLHGGS